MSETATATELLIVAVQDLSDGAQAWTEHAVALRKATGDRLLSSNITAFVRSAEAAIKTLKAITDDLGAPSRDARNLWLRAELDDAARDAATIVSGPLRDIALIGAFRKAKQSERVSYETAVLLARRLTLGAAAQELAELRNEAGEADRALARMQKSLIVALDR